MKFLKFLSLTTCVAATLTFSEACCEEVVFKSPGGDLVVLDVQPEDSFLDVVAHAEKEMTFLDEGQIAFEDQNETDSLALLQPKEYMVDCLAFRGFFSRENAAKAVPRSYEAGFTQSEKDDITWIISTLGFASLTEIAKNKSKLEKTGDRVDRVHPFRFLQIIFTDEKLKAAAHNIQGRTSFIWDGFFGGIKRSLVDESKLNNVTPYINDFASVVGIDPTLIAPAINEKRWKDFVIILINKVPRQGDTGRYDM